MRNYWPLANVLQKWPVLLLCSSNDTQVAACPVDYRCKDGRFPVSASCVTMSNPDSLSRSKTEVNTGIRS